MANTDGDRLLKCIFEGNPHDLLTPLAVACALKIAAHLIHDDPTVAIKYGTDVCERIRELSLGGTRA